MTGKIQIPEKEYHDRVLKAQQKLSTTDLDFLLVNSNDSDFANVRYFSGYWPLFEMAGVIIPREGEPILLIGPESGTYAQERSKIKKIRKMLEYRESADPDYPGVQVTSFLQLVEEMGIRDIRKIGIAGYLVTTLPIYESLKHHFPNAIINNADEIVTGLRSIKSPSEINCLRESNRISEIAVGEVLNQIKPGMTELEVVGLVQGVIYANGAEYEGMPQFVLSGNKTNNAISRPTHKMLRKNEMVQLGLSARVDGYSSCVSRPVFLGKMSDSMRKKVEFGKQAHEKTMEWLKAGVMASEVADAYFEFFVRNGYENNYLYGPCHGLGLIEVEPPWMESTSKYVIQKNMTFQVDTFFQDTSFGFRWENGVRILSKGVERFSFKNMDLIEVQ